MVRPLADAGVGTPASFLRKTFELSRALRAQTSCGSARSASTAPSSTAKRVGNDLLTPGWTSYDKRLSYQTYEVGDAAQARAKRHRHLARRRLVPLADDVDEEPDLQHLGQRDRRDRRAAAAPGADAAVVVETDASWASGELPIRKSGIYFGEIYDARLEALEADSGSAAIAVRHRPAGPARDRRRCASSSPSLAVLTWQDAEGRTVYDFGQNAAGYVAFTVEGRGRRQGHRRARRDPRPATAVRQRATTAPPRRGSNTC